jgi:hypothetical protein
VARVELSVSEIRRLWAALSGKADFSSHGFSTWLCPIPPYFFGLDWEMKQPRDDTRPAPFRVVEFRLRHSLYGVPGEYGYLITEVLGNGHVVETNHHTSRRVFIPFDAKPMENT